MLFTLFAFLSLANANAAMFGVYSDSACQELVTPVLAFSDVCTWSSHSTSYALYLTECSSSSISVQVFNASDSAMCAPFPTNESFTVTNTCQLYSDYYIQLVDTTECLGENTTFNIVAHDTADCSDGGLPFTIVAANSSCVDNSFAPSYMPGSWDTKTFVAENFFLLQVFQETNSSCINELGVFLTPNLTGQCVAPISGFSNSTFIQAFNAFPLSA